MKQLLVLFSAFLLLIACSENDNDDLAVDFRDDFVGSYEGIMAWESHSLSQDSSGPFMVHQGDTSQIVIIVTKGSCENCLILDHPTYDETIEISEGGTFSEHPDGYSSYSGNFRSDDSLITWSSYYYLPANGQSEFKGKKIQ